MAILSGLLVFTLALDYWIIQQFPVVYWNDAFIRLAMRDELLVGRWLPLLQLAILVTSIASRSLAIVRIALSLFAVMAVWAMHRFAGRLFDPVTGLVAASLLASQTMFIALSTVPYQEVLFIALILLAFSKPDVRQPKKAPWQAVIPIGLACVTRYEAWLFVPVFLMRFFPRHRRQQGSRVQAMDAGAAAIVLAIFPLLWIMIGPFDVGETELEVVARILAGDTGVFFREFLKLAEWQIRPEGWILAGLGLVSGLRLTRTRRATLQTLTLIALQLSFIALFNPFSPENLRVPFFTSVMLLPFAAKGYCLLAGAIASLLHRLRLAGPGKRTRLAVLFLLVLAAFVTGTLRGIRFVRGAALTADYQSPAAAGVQFGGTPHGGVLLLKDDPLAPFIFAAYADLSFDLLYSLEPSPLENRISGLSPGRVREAGITHIISWDALEGLGLLCEPGFENLPFCGIEVTVRTRTEEITIWEVDAPTRSDE